MRESSDRFHILFICRGQVDGYSDAYVEQWLGGGEPYPNRRYPVTIHEAMVNWLTLGETFEILAVSRGVTEAESCNAYRTWCKLRDKGRMA